MDEDFEFFLEKFGPAFDRRDVPESAIARYRGKLPDQLLAYWEEHGWCGYADGLLWTVDPQEYEPALDAWIGETALMERDAYHVVARSAFGELYFWGERTGASLSLLPWRAMAVPSDGSPELIAQGRANDVLRWRFAGFKRQHFELEDREGTPLFQRAIKKLGRLDHDEMYGFVPALALGGPASLDHLQKVKAVDHLVLLAQLSELRTVPPVRKAKPDQVFEYFCKGRDIPIFSANATIGSIAGELGLQVQHWVEDGLGPQRGFNIRLVDGPVVRAEECVERMDLGVVVYADAADLPQFGMQRLVALCTEALSIRAGQITWRQSAQDATEPNLPIKRMPDGAA